MYIRGFCHLAGEERTFKVERIIEAEVYGKAICPMAFFNELCKDREEFDKCSLNGVSFCITGKLKIMTRRQAQVRIEAYGGTFHSYIQHNTSYLVAENAGWNTSKLVEARAHKIPIIDEETFIDYLSEPNKAHKNKPPIKDKYEFYKESVESDLDVRKKYVTNDQSVQEPNYVLKEGHGPSFCFEGELNTITRGEAENKVKSFGGYVSPIVAKGLSYLVTNRPDSKSKKLKVAKENSIPIIDEEAFLALLEKKPSRN